MPLKLSTYKGSPNWRCRGTVRGISFDRSTGTADRDAAEQIRIKWEGALLHSSIHGARATKSFADAFVNYARAGGERRYCGPLVEHFGETPLAHIDQAAIDAAADALKPNAGPATRNRQIYTPMAAILHHAAKRGWTDYRRVERPKQPPGRVRWLDPDQAERLIEACAPHLRPLVIFLFGTGARLSEGLYLEWKNVDLAARRVRFMETKNGEPRGVPLNERVFVELANLDHRDGAVFRRPDGAPYARRRDSGGPVKTAFQGACRRAGIEDFTPHDCRHTWASWFYGATRDLGALMELGGWKSETMVLRYVHLNPDHLAAAINSLPWEKSGSLDIKAANS